MTTVVTPRIESIAVDLEDCAKDYTNWGKALGYMAAAELRTMDRRIQLLERQVTALEDRLIELGAEEA